MIRPRVLARFLAWLGGYFWLPRPICGRMFAGFEWLPGNTLWVSESTGQGVCEQCAAEAARRSAPMLAAREAMINELVRNKFAEHGGSA